ncbi:MAG: flavohemoglobin expression-modulating QEGLA motif protein [Longimicrobiales bacterium]
MPQVREDARIEAAVARYRSGEGVRASFRGGTLRVDRPLPFLFVHRATSERMDLGTNQLLFAESSYLVTTPDADEAVAHAWVEALARIGAERFGAFLIIELWAEDDATSYCVRCPEGEASETTAQLAAALEEVIVPAQPLPVELEPGEQRGPDGLAPLLTIRQCHELGALYIGLRLPALYRDIETQSLYPVFLRNYRAGLSRALRRTAYVFAQVQTDADLSSAAALGTRTVDRTVWDADAELARVERTYRFLLLVSPTNADAAWEEFRVAEFRAAPKFHYRLLPVDPGLLKRRLYAIDVESIADPALGLLLRDKRDEIDRQISMLAERHTPAFLAGSTRLYGATTPALRALARAVLERQPPGAHSGDRGAPVDAIAFVQRARQEIAAYRAQVPVDIAAPQLRPDIAGLMVSDGVLLVGRNLKIEPRRVEALIHHEVGTHVLTHANGSAQPLAQLATGLADYDEFQEGIAVVTEYLAGGLTVGRLRLLGARVLAAASVEDGASFLDTFTLLRAELGFSARGAYSIATRVHQSGGFTRDMIYLRGLERVLDLIAHGTDLESLFMGKFAGKHIPILHELRQRGVLLPPPLRPRVLDVPGADERLARLRAGATPVTLVEEAA